MLCCFTFLRLFTSHMPFPTNQILLPFLSIQAVLNHDPKKGGNKFNTFQLSYSWFFFSLSFSFISLFLRLGALVCSLPYLIFFLRVSHTLSGCAHFSFTWPEEGCVEWWIQLSPILLWFEVPVFLLKWSNAPQALFIISTIHPVHPSFRDHPLRFLDFLAGIFPFRMTCILFRFYINFAIGGESRWSVCISCFHSPGYFSFLIFSHF